MAAPLLGASLHVPTTSRAASGSAPRTVTNPRRCLTALDPPPAPLFHPCRLPVSGGPLRYPTVPAAIPAARGPCRRVLQLLCPPGASRYTR